MGLYKSKLNHFPSKLQLVPSGVIFNIKETVDTEIHLPLIGNTQNDARVTADTGHLWVWNGTTWVDQGDIIDVLWDSIEGKPVSTPAQIDNAVSDSHTHNNIIDLNLVSGTNTGDQSDNDVPNTSNIPVTNVKDALDFLYSKSNLDKTVILRRTVFLNRSNALTVKINRFIFWNPSFIKIYKVVGAVRTEINILNLLPYNTFDMFRNRYKNDEIDSSDCFMVTEFGFHSSLGIMTGDIIEIEYTETKRDLTQPVSLIYKGWNFITNRPYSPKATNNFPSSPMQVYSSVVPRILTINSEKYNVIGFEGYNIFNINIPTYIEANIQKVADSSLAKTHFLIPNLIYCPELDFASSFGNLRLEAYELPRKCHIQSSSFYRFLGYYTLNQARITNLFTNSVGNRRRYYKIGFRFRDITTNSVSDWLPLQIIVNRSFRVSGTTVSQFVRFKI